MVSLLVHVALAVVLWFLVYARMRQEPITLTASSSSTSQTDARLELAEEVERLSHFVETAKAMFEEDAEAAKLMAVEPLGELPEGTDVAEMAAWTVVGNVILNLDEIFMKR